ncbi:MAG: hypothetical protein JWN04_2408, partial [Myxococcaceae bacterium]|nr:hypothetical protein [Myxococcaceae bacterium]
MQPSKKAEPGESVLLDYTSPDGPALTHVRGTLVVNSIESLRQLGVLPRYESLLSPALREQLLFALAASWLPVESVLEHYRACDALQLSDEQTKRSGELVAARNAHTLLGAAMRLARRNTGVDSYVLVMSRLDTLLARLYREGRCLVTRTGPKDLRLESHGLVLAESQYFRAAYYAYNLATAKLFCNVAYVKPTRPREP